MSLRTNFKFHECDKVVVFRKVYDTVAPIAIKYDLIEDGHPPVLLENDRGELLGTDSVANQIQSVAYHSREAMVRTCLDVCRFLSGQAEGTKLLINGCFFLHTAIAHVWTLLHHFPENPDFDGVLHAIPQRPSTFYDSDFWSSSIVQSWLVVNTVYNWFEIYMKRWALAMADKALAAR